MLTGRWLQVHHVLSVYTMHKGVLRCDGCTIVTKLFHHPALNTLYTMQRRQSASTSCCWGCYSLWVTASTCNSAVPPPSSEPSWSEDAEAEACRKSMDKAVNSLQIS